MTTGDKELINDQETAVAVSELSLEGLIDWKGDEEIELNEKGIDYAWGLWKKLPPKERLTLFLLFGMLEEAIKHGSKTDAV